MYFFRANLENQDLRGRNFDGADFRKANLRMAVLEDVSGQPARKIQKDWLRFLGNFLSEGGAFEPLSKEVVTPANFSEADLTGANLRRAKLSEASLRGAILRNAILSEAILVNADLCEADLGNANLCYADLRGALLYKANLEGADLTGAKLDAADFELARLKNTILHNVNLRNVKNLRSEDLAGADLSGTISPTPLNHEPKAPPRSDPSAQGGENGQLQVPAAVDYQLAEADYLIEDYGKDQLQFPPSAAEQLRESHGSSLGKLAMALSITMVASSTLLLSNSFLPLGVTDRLFWVLFYGIPVGCLVAISVSIMELRRGQTTGKYPIIAMAMSAMVLAVFAFWHLLGLGLGGAYFPCLVDSGALVLTLTFLVMPLRRKSGP